MYDIFIYTGKSPVNTPGLGILHLLSKVRGICDNRNQRGSPGQDEEMGEVIESPPNSDRTQVGEEERELQDQNNQPVVEEAEEVEDKNEPYDQPQIESRSESRRGSVHPHGSRLLGKESKDTTYDGASQDRNRHYAYDGPSGS